MHFMLIFQLVTTMEHCMVEAIILVRMTVEYLQLQIKFAFVILEDGIFI